MAKIKINIYGEKRYYNDDRELHREDGPAAIYPDGTKKWYNNGRLSNFDGPSEMYKSGLILWRQGSWRNRSNGPAMETPNGYKLWHNDGRWIWPLLG